MRQGDLRLIRHSDFERSIGDAEKALNHLRANKLPAHPRYYELWYTYVSGFNRALNRAVDEALAHYGHVPESVIQDIYEQYLSPARMSDRVEAVSGGLVRAFEQVSGAIDEVEGSALSYRQSLKQAAETLKTASDGEAVRAVVDALLDAAEELGGRARTLKTRLVDSRQHIDALSENLETVRTATITDALTGIANRKHFDQEIKQAVRNGEDTGEPLALLLADIDHFKAFNDNFGHQTGDQVLRLVAHALKINVKGRDLAARYGGEEFAVILPRTALKDAMTVAEQIRKSIVAKELVKKSTGESLGVITMSIGVAAYRPGETVDALIARADTGLYAAKRAGRNRVVSEPAGPAMATEVA